MNREIKFRMWDGQEMIYDKSNLESFFYTWEYIEDRKAPLMQYTGLKDKNGVEIYEGDIVEFFTGPIMFENKLPTYLYEEDWEKSFVVKFEELKYNIINDSFRYRIIGNIYENPELLKEEEK